MNKRKKRYLLLAIILFTIALIVINIGGQNFTYKVEINTSDINKVNIKIEQEKDIIKIINKKIVNNTLELKIKGLNKGIAFIDIEDGDIYYTNKYYVHPFGVITKGSYFGKSNNDIIIPIVIIIYLIYTLYDLIKNYKINIKKSMYQYKNITSLGLIIFLFSTLLNIFLTTLNYGGLENSINDIISSGLFFSTLLIPSVIIVSIFVIINNINLLRKEGISPKNMLGILLALFVITASIFPEIMNNYFQRAEFINIHNEKSITLYIYQFIETFIFICLSYLECNLIGTIILEIKAAKHIPEYNKDYIIILGCMIKKDGTLTPLLKGRVDRAIEFAKLQKENTNKDIIFIPSGGKGNDEIIAESIAIKNYLLDQSINNKNIIVEDKSTNTYENIRNSYSLIKDKNSNIAFSTTNYHVFRAGNIALNQNIIMEGIGSKTKIYFWVNAFIREFVATLYTEKKKHLKFICLILLLSIILLIIKYIAVIL